MVRLCRADIKLNERKKENLKKKKRKIEKVNKTKAKSKVLREIHCLSTLLSFFKLANCKES
jgi:hypothetical protein